MPFLSLTLTVGTKVTICDSESKLMSSYATILFPAAIPQLYFTSGSKSGFFDSTLA